ncbi:MAG: NIPSNAP family protein [Christiangramia sp.]|nr:NIPSNAP family protein [Christiangramia sp.]
MNFNLKNFLKSLTSFCLFLSFINGHAQSQKRDIYELKIYHLENHQQEEQIDSFLKSAYIPALHRTGVKQVGVFKPVKGDSLSGKRVYVLTPYKSIENLIKTPQTLKKDKDYLSKGEDYINAAHNNPPYESIETIVLQAFEGMPQFRENDLGKAPERIYELRSYESATEKLHHNKVEMFNNGEIDIFEDLKFNPIFFAEVVAGSNMPNLMYMTSFKDKASRDEHWKAFSEDPAWKGMASDEQYQNNVSHIDIFFLNPTSYSEL